MSLLNLIIPPQVKIALFVGPLLAVGLFAGVQTWRVGNLKSDNRILQTSLTNLTHASKRATEAATRIKVATETRNITIKDNADAALDTARVDSDRRLADYIRLHRPTAASSTSNPDLSKPAAAPEIDNGTGGSAVVDATDLAICTRNTDRLNNAHDWSVAVSTPIEGAN